MGDPNAFFEKLHVNHNGTILIVPLSVHEKQKYFEEYYYGKTLLNAICCEMCVENISLLKQECMSVGCTTPALLSYPSMHCGKGVDLPRG